MWSMSQGSGAFEKLGVGQVLRTSGRALVPDQVVAGDPPGPHRLRLRVVGAGGRIVEQERFVLVSPTSPADAAPETP